MKFLSPWSFCSIWLWAPQILHFYLVLFLLWNFFFSKKLSFYMIREPQIYYILIVSFFPLSASLSPQSFFSTWYWSLKIYYSFIVVFFSFTKFFFFHEPFFLHDMRFLNLLFFYRAFLYEASFSFFYRTFFSLKPQIPNTFI